MKKVLVVDDEPIAAQIVKAISGRLLGGVLEVIGAQNLTDAELLFQEHAPDLKCIMVDACLVGDTPDTEPFVRMVREAGYTGPMIAISRDEHYCDQLVAAGCSHQCHKKHPRFPHVIAKAMGIAISEP